MGSEEENASGSCTITFNTVALGGPLVTYKVDL